MVTQVLSRAIGVALAAASVGAVLVACATPDSVAVREYVDEAIAGLDAGYFAGRPGWDEAVEEALPTLYAAESMPDTYPLLSDLTQVAGGQHSFFSTPAEMEAFARPYPAGQVPIPTASYTGGVGTVVIPSFSSAHQDEIDQYLTAAADIFASPDAQASCGWVVDLSTNSGGDPRVMLVALSPLLDDGVILQYRDRDGATSQVVVDGTSLSWDDEAWGRLPGDVPKADEKPVALVQLQSSASAAEHVIAAFSGQPTAETWGTESGGFTTVNDGFRLPDGAFVTLSFAILGDRDGTFFDGPIPPDHAMSPSEGSSLRAAQSSVAGQCSAS